MKILEKFINEFPEHEWALKKESNISYILYCDDKPTNYGITNFKKMFIPGMSKEDKKNMTKKNVYAIIDKIKKSGIN